MHPTPGLGLLLAGLLVVKGFPEHKPSPNGEVSKGKQTAQELARRNTEFGFRLFKKLASTEPHGNIFFSPLSLSTAFSMLSLGAQDSTLEEIQRAFCFHDMPDKELHEGFHYLIQELNQQNQDLKLDLSNILFIDRGLQPRQKFMTDVKSLYNADTIPTDFHNLEATQKQINDYVHQKTHGKISNLIKRIDSGTVMLLINYIYFRARWKHEFDPKQTREEDFMLGQNKSVKVPMMFQGGMFKVGYDNQLSCTVLEMPYQKDFMAMFILPDVGKVEAVEEAMVTKVMLKWKKMITERVVDVFMPKFTITGTYNLKKLFSHLGITKIFEEHGDLTRISPHRSLKVGEAIHKANLRLDEKGSEGAAGTGAQTLPMEKPEEVRFNRTFLMMICQEKTSSVLFLGKITNPAGS
ncbi:serpin A12 [Echinops telfairi]|uniref:Serpin A12 n=1 Tax=Echinops telfairi TaxID=9371 RepID=A0ABM0IFV5_ECHTE|nr:serpin A12 [Echinops telfairi]